MSVLSGTDWVNSGSHTPTFGRICGREVGSTPSEQMSRLAVGYAKAHGAVSPFLGRFALGLRPHQVRFFSSLRHLHAIYPCERSSQPGPQRRGLHALDGHLHGRGAPRNEVGDDVRVEAVGPASRDVALAQLVRLGHGWLLPRSGVVGRSVDHGAPRRKPALSCRFLEDGVDSGDGVSLHPGQNVRVGVQSDRRGGMSEPLRHHLDRDPGLQQLARVSVPQIVVIPAEFRADPFTIANAALSGFHNGLALAGTAAAPMQVGYIDKSGKFVIAPKDGAGTSFFSGPIAEFWLNNGDSIKYIDLTGRVLFEGVRQDNTGST